MKFVGIDLAGSPKNFTGFCLLEVEKNRKIAHTKLLHSDNEIVEKIEKLNPELIAIDAPLIYSGVDRKCDDLLKKYGALPVTLRGMEVLALRGSKLANELKKKNFKFIEIFATASAKILGFYAETEREMQKNLINSDLKGDVEKRFLCKDELDAIFAAITAYLHFSNSTELVGDDDSGMIVIPKV